jgi:hypothetical protein
MVNPDFSPLPCMFKFEIEVESQIFSQFYLKLQTFDFVHIIKQLF